MPVNRFFCWPIAALSATVAALALAPVLPMLTVMVLFCFIAGLPGALVALLRALYHRQARRSAAMTCYVTGGALLLAYPRIVAPLANLLAP